MDSSHSNKTTPHHRHLDFPPSPHPRPTFAIAPSIVFTLTSEETDSFNAFLSFLSFLLNNKSGLFTQINNTTLDISIFRHRAIDFTFLYFSLFSLFSLTTNLDLKIRALMSGPIVLGHRLAWPDAFQEAVHMLHESYMNQVEQYRHRRDLSDYVRDGYIHFHSRALRYVHLYPITATLALIEHTNEFKHALPAAIESLQACLHQAFRHVMNINPLSTNTVYTLNYAWWVQGHELIVDFNTPLKINRNEFYTSLKRLIDYSHRHGAPIVPEQVLSFLAITEQCWIKSFLNNPHGLRLGQNELGMLRDRMLQQAKLVAAEPNYTWQTEWEVFDGQPPFIIRREIEAKRDLEQKNRMSAAPAPAAATAAPAPGAAAGPRPLLSVFGWPVIPLDFKGPAPSFAQPPTTNNTPAKNTGSSSSSSSGRKGGCCRYLQTPNPRRSVKPHYHRKLA
jgi:uncharacterized protein YlbG (UPF0298 family)